MIETLLSLDRELFFLVNTKLAIAPLDGFFQFFTAGDVFYAKQIWNGMFAAFLLMLLWKGGVRGRWLVAALIVGVVAGDQLSSSFIKPFVARIRPCSELVTVRLLVNCGSGYSFPSSHAVNMFSAAFIASRFYSESRPWGYILASIIAYSRVYVGVHYPLDVIGGAVFGIAVGYGVIKIFQPIVRRWG